MEAAQDGLTLALARRSSALTFEELEPDVVELARQCLLDWLGVTIAGAREPAPSMLLEVLGEPGLDPGEVGGAAIVGRGLRMAPLQAALVNGTASHVLDFDDVNLGLPGHVSVAILGAALALAEDLDRDGAAVLTAYVAGYELACAVAAAIGTEPYLRGFHATSTVGVFGATASCARLLGLDAQRTAIALGMAASHSAGSKANLGTMTKSLHAGRACESGLLCALLAARGFTAHPAGIEGPQGFAALSGAGCDAQAALAAPSRGWHLRDNLFKYHAACYFTHSAIEGLRELRASGEVADVDQIRRVTLHITEVERGACVIPAPETGLEVKFSIAHLAAMALLGRDTAVISDRDAADAEAIALRARVELADDGVAGQPTRAEVELADGRVLQVAHDASVPDRDLTRQGIRLAAKFDALASPILGAEQAAELRDRVGLFGAGKRTGDLLALTDPMVRAAR